MPQNPETSRRPSRDLAGCPQIVTPGSRLKRCFCSLAPRNSQKPKLNSRTIAPAAMGDSGCPGISTSHQPARQ